MKTRIWTVEFYWPVNGNSRNWLNVWTDKRCFDLTNAIKDLRRALYQLDNRTLQGDFQKGVLRMRVRNVETDEIVPHEALGL